MLEVVPEGCDSLADAPRFKPDDIERYDCDDVGDSEDLAETPADNPWMATGSPTSIAGVRDGELGP